MAKAGRVHRDVGQSTRLDELPAERMATRADAVLALQRQAGNRATRSVLQREPADAGTEAEPEDAGTKKAPRMTVEASGIGVTELYQFTDNLSKHSLSVTIPNGSAASAFIEHLTKNMPIAHLKITVPSASLDFDNVTVVGVNVTTSLDTRHGTNDVEELVKVELDTTPKKPGH
jgi:hypothetical protein